MRNRIVIILLLIAIFMPLKQIMAQGGISSGGVTSTTARHIRYSASAPSTCSPSTGDVYWNTSTKAMYACTATNTWTSLGSAGGTPQPIDVTDSPTFAGMTLSSSILNIGNNASVRASAGEIRLINGAVMAWKNAGNDANYSFGFGADDQFELSGTTTLTGSIGDSYINALRFHPHLTATTALTVSRFNYIDLFTPSLAGDGPAAVTDAAVFHFDANVGTHKALDTSTIFGDGWMKVNVNGSIKYIPYSAQKTYFTNPLSLGAAWRGKQLEVFSPTNATGAAAFYAMNNQTSVVKSALNLFSETSGDMADGFGVGFNMYLRDSAAVDNLAGQIATVRAGADGTADIVISPSTTGSPTERFRFTATGKFIIVASSSPATTDACTAGSLTWDTSYAYLCTVSGAWKKISYLETPPYALTETADTIIMNGNLASDFTVTMADDADGATLTVINCAPTGRRLHLLVNNAAAEVLTYGTGITVVAGSTVDPLSASPPAPISTSGETDLVFRCTNTTAAKLISIYRDAEP